MERKGKAKVTATTSRRKKAVPSKKKKEKGKEKRDEGDKSMSVVWPFQWTVTRHDVSPGDTLPWSEETEPYVTGVDIGSVNLGFEAIGLETGRVLAMSLVNTRCYQDPSRRKELTGDEMVESLEEVMDKCKHTRMFTPRPLPDVVVWKSHRNRLLVDFIRQVILMHGWENWHGSFLDWVTRTLILLPLSLEVDSWRAVFSADLSWMIRIAVNAVGTSSALMSDDKYHIDVKELQVYALSSYGFPSIFRSPGTTGMRVEPSSRLMVIERQPPGGPRERKPWTNMMLQTIMLSKAGTERTCILGAAEGKKLYPENFPILDGKVSTMAERNKFNKKNADKLKDHIWDDVEKKMIAQLPKSRHHHVVDAHLMAEYARKEHEEHERALAKGELIYV